MKRYVLAALVACFTLTGFVAVAAALGGITADDLGADNAAVGSCDTDGVTTSYTVAYDATDARDEMTATDVGAIPGIDYVEDAVVTDGKVVTSRGPGTAMDFALELIELLAGQAKREEVEAPLLRP